MIYIITAHYNVLSALHTEMTHKYRLKNMLSLDVLLKYLHCLHKQLK